MSATVHIERGIPGSGKSSHAKTLTTPEFICSADDYFVGKDGVYKFVQHEIGKAHQSCLKKFVDILHRYNSSDDVEWDLGFRYGPDIDVVVDNTNLRKWEYETYVKVAQLADFKVEFHEFVPPRDNTLGDYVRLCASRNVHGVSPNQCMRMAAIFEAHS